MDQNNTQTSRKKKLDVSWLALFLSMLTFAYTFFPQLNLFNSNYIDRANAGDIDAQMFLAEHYYEVGDIKESHYWYKIAAMSDGDHKGAALNNIAYIGITYKYYGESIEEYYETALSLFRKAICYGDKCAVSNYYELLTSHKDQWSTIDYDKELAWFIHVCNTYGFEFDEITSADVEWAKTQFPFDPARLNASTTGLAYDINLGPFPCDDPFSKIDTDYHSYAFQVSDPSA